MKSVLRSGMSLLALAGMLMVASPSYALSVDVTKSANNGAVDLNLPGGALTLTLTGLPSVAVSDVLVTVSVFGDFNLASEYIDLSVDGLSGGRWLDNDLGNDAIDGPAGDVGNQYGSTITGTTTISMALINPLLVDNTLEFLFDYSAEVGNNQAGDFASVRIEYDYQKGTAPTPAVPEPSTMLLLGTGLVGMVAWRMKKGQA